MYQKKLYNTNMFLNVKRFVQWIFLKSTGLTDFSSSAWESNRIYCIGLTSCTLKAETQTEIVLSIELYRYYRRHSEHTWSKCGALGQTMHNLIYLIDVYLPFLYSSASICINYVFWALKAPLNASVTIVQFYSTQRHP